MGVDGIAVDLIMISGGSSDVEQLLVDSKRLDIVVQCLTNSATPEYAASVAPCM